MWDFSDDETAFMLAAGAVGIVGLFRFYLNIIRAIRWLAEVLPVANTACIDADSGSTIVLLYIVLHTLADPMYVAGHLDYTLLFMAGGALWIFGAAEGFVMLGISMRDDALERGNFPAAVTVAGGMFAVMLVYAGSNVGNGPTIWTTLWPALVATICLMLLWGIAELVSGTRDAITIDRDPATAIQNGRVFNGCRRDPGPRDGRRLARLGRHISGVHSSGLACGDLRACHCDFELFTRAPTPSDPRPSIVSHGLIPAAVVIACATAYVISLGWPQIAPCGKI